jgi:hypothetical protein
MEMREISHAARKSTLEAIRVTQEAVVESIQAFERVISDNEESSRSAQKAVRASLRIFEKAIKGAAKMGTLNLESTGEQIPEVEELQAIEATKAFNVAMSKIKETPDLTEQAAMNANVLPDTITLEGAILKPQASVSARKETKKEAKDIKSRLNFLSNMYNSDKSDQNMENSEETIETEEQDE